MVMGDVIEFKKEPGIPELLKAVGDAVAKAPRPYGPTYEPTYGAKYERGLSRKEVAKRIRTDIKAGVKAGSLPRAKYSVRIENYSGGGSISIAASELPFEVLSEARVLADRDEPHRFSGLNWMSERGEALRRSLKAIGGAYNRDASDPMVDYFDCDYYLCVELRHPENERESILARNGR
jgi:hypothetical protein